MNLFQPLTLYGLLVLLGFFIHLFKSIDEYTNAVPPRTFQQYMKAYLWKNLISVTSIVTLFIITWYQIPDKVTTEGVISALGIGYLPDVAINKILPKSVTGKTE
jgi:hypothetical protein